MYDFSKRTDEVFGSVHAIMAEHTMSVIDSPESTQMQTNELKVLCPPIKQQHVNVKKRTNVSKMYFEPVSSSHTMH